MRVLLIEDQHDIAANIWDFLERRGHEVDHCGDGASGLDARATGWFDAIVLDLGCRGSMVSTCAAHCAKPATACPC
jgi:DNA-binding response OmpR family regulator